MICARCGGEILPSGRCSRCGAAAHDSAADDAALTSDGGSSGAAAATGPLVANQTFGSRYRIIRPLGVGGMGAVYQALDAELGVTVAMKVIRPDTMQDATVAAEIEKRFKRELVLARQVTHKNVVRIYDLGEIDGIKYITMSYVDGADIATRIQRDGPMPVPAVMQIARQVIAGLVEAHKAGVVHRDLKPANIMIDRDNHALIMDFGIARPSGAPKYQSDVANHLPTGVHAKSTLFEATLSGSVVGTMAYMAPEQAAGLDVDQRADIYAFGLILYDMLVGRRRAQHAKSAVEELESRIKAAPAPVKSIRPEVPDALDQIIARCLEPDRDKRFATSADLAAALDRLDDNAIPIPEQRGIPRGMAVAAAVLVATLAGATWWFTRTPPPPKQHEPVAVLIADFDNTTGDPAFTHSLEPMIKLALEEAAFISAHDRKGIRDQFGVQPPEKLDAAAARDFAARQGVSVVLSGSVGREGGGYAMSLQLIETLTGKVLSTVTGNASAKDQVVVAATKMVATIRKALGDDKSDSTQMFAMASVSAASPEVLQNYAAAREASSNLKYDDASAYYAKTIELDPKFGIGYQGLAALARNQNHLDEAQKYITEALKYLDGMTERERYATRGLYYTLTGDYQQCSKEYDDLIARYPVDVLAHNNLALCLSFLRNMPKAVNEVKRSVELVPKRALFRINLALYANYAGDFAAAKAEEATLTELGRPQWALFNRALAELGQGELDSAATTYEQLGKTDALGTSWMSSGLGDLAIQRGKFSEAVGILERGAAAEINARNNEKAAQKYAALAYAHILAKQTVPAISAAEKALAANDTIQIRFLAGRIFVEAGDSKRAEAQIAPLAAEVHAEPQAYAKILQGGLALKRGDAPQAVKLLEEANALLDTWIGRFDLGRAYLEAGKFAEADAEFDRCIQRRGEALALFLNEEPTYAYFPPVHYYRGRAREAMKKPEAAESYRAYLALRGTSTEDALVSDARRGAGGTQ